MPARPARYKSWVLQKKVHSGRHTPHGAYHTRHTLGGQARRPQGRVATGRGTPSTLNPQPYRGTLLMRNRNHPQDHYRALGIGLLEGSMVERFLMSEVPLYTLNPKPSVGRQAALEVASRPEEGPGVPRS